MKIKSFFQFATFGIKTILFRKKEPILGTVIITDKCNLKCKHCSVNNITAILHPYEQVKKEMQMLQHLVGPDADSDGLLNAARALATHRVVVKRPTKAPFLANQPPHSQVATKKHRFDIYIKQAY